VGGYGVAVLMENGEVWSTLVAAQSQEGWEAYHSGDSRAEKIDTRQEQVYVGEQEAMIEGRGRNGGEDAV